MRSVALGRHLLRIDDDQPTFWDRVENGLWEPGTLAVLDRFVGAGTLFLDLGAWVGPLTLYAAALGARVVAVEADPSALDQLRRNLAANPNLAAGVTVVPRAVAPSPGHVRMGARRKPGDSMSSVLLADAATAWDSGAVTPAELAGLIRLDERLFMKLDIEGGEYGLLPACAPLLRRPQAAALVSFHPDILHASRAADPGTLGRTALTAFAGWQAIGVDDAALTSHDPEGLVADGVPRGEWLFLKGYPPLCGPEPAAPMQPR